MAGRSLSEQINDCTERCRNMDAPLAVRLSALAEDVRKLDAGFAEVVEQMIARLRAAGAGAEAPRPGEPMPEFVLPDQDGRLVSLSSLLRQGPVAVAFHRGHWCPYCRINARALAEINPEVTKLGAKLVAITPEFEEFTSELAADADTEFPILSDVDNGYAMLLKLAFYVGDVKRQHMSTAGWTIADFQGNDNWVLPIPATFIVGRDGLVKARFVDPDYRRRMDIDELMSGLRLAAGERSGSE